MMKKYLDAILIAGYLAVLTGTFFYVGLAYWGWFMVGFDALLAFVEIIAKITTGNTISQHFGTFRRKNPKAAIGILVILTIGWAGLIWHLLAM